MTTTAPARRVAAAVEPFAAQVYFAPECHEAYEALGFGPSPARVGGVEMPDGPAYFCSRASCLGQVPGQVVASTFAVFNPAVVVPAVELGWTRADAATLSTARTKGSLAQLERLLGAEPDGVARAVELLAWAGQALRPEGRSLYAGMLALPLPESPLGAAWRLADRLREFRGDSHTAAWTAAGFDATEIGLLAEGYWGVPLRSYVRTRAWSDADLDAAVSRLESRGLVAGGQMTAEGRAARERIEVATDAQCTPLVDSLDDALGELVAILQPWGEAIRAGGGYPDSGPHDLARLAAAG